MEVVWYLSAGAGLGVTGPARIQHWILLFGEVSGNLRLIVADFAEWIAMERPPWDSYCTLMSGHLIVWYRNPGVRSVGVGGTWWRLVPKCVLKVAVQDADEGCITDQLCGGMEDWIENGIHSIILLWQQHAQKEE